MAAGLGHNPALCPALSATMNPSESQPADAPVAGAAAADKSSATASANACAQQLKTLFPAVFGGAPRPLKLRIQADIQERAPGQFSKQQLSAVLRRLTGSTAYLIALSRSQHRYDLDGKEAGELSTEHRDAAVQELARRRTITQERRAQEQQERQRLIGLMRAFETTTLTRANFCALKGVDEAQLDALLVQAREALQQEQREREQRPGGPQQRPDRRPRPDGAPGERRRDGATPRGQDRPGGARKAAPKPPSNRGDRE